MVNKRFWIQIFLSNLLIELIYCLLHCGLEVWLQHIYSTRHFSELRVMRYLTPLHYGPVQQATGKKIYIKKQTRCSYLEISFKQ